MNMDNVSYITLLTPLVVTNLRPTDDVRELFNKKTHGMKKTDLNAHHSVDRRAEMAKRYRKKLFEFEGRYDDYSDETAINLFKHIGGNKDGNQ